MDVDRLKIFVHEFCLRGLLPVVERQMRLLWDQAEKLRGKGILTSIWSRAGGTTSSPAAPALSPQQNAGTANYTQESVEMQVKLRSIVNSIFLNIF
jgi:ER-Golgi trafficking TRAPP I complex 85 kDa subunit